MAPLDQMGGLPDLSEAEPSGPNLEFDAAFGALERAAQGKPEKQYGDTIIPAEEPDWKDVGAQAAELLERTRDLRVLSHLAVARLHLKGLAAFVEVLAQTRVLLETRWDSVHPQLDPEDDNDPTLRSNALLRVCDPLRVIRFIRLLPLAASPMGGPFSWRDIGLAIGAIENDGTQNVVSETTIRGVFADTDPERLAGLREAAMQGGREAAAISAAFDTQAGSGTGPDFDDLIKLLREVERYIARYAPAADAPAVEDLGAAESGSGPVPDGGALPQAGFAPGPAASPARGPASIASIASIESRTDAMRALDLAKAYFERHEPSSPLPLLIDRAKRLADMSFMEILRDLAPDGLGQAQIVVQAPDA